MFLFKKKMHKKQINPNISFKSHKSNLCQLSNFIVKRNYNYFLLKIDFSCKEKSIGFVSEKRKKSLFPLLIHSINPNISLLQFPYA